MFPACLTHDNETCMGPGQQPLNGQCFFDYDPIIQGLAFSMIKPSSFFFASGDGQPRWKGFANSNESKSYEHL